MVTQPGVQLHMLVLLFSVVDMSQPVCVDVPSATEAVLGEPMKLTCIACMKREEIKARTRVDWYYMPTKEKNVPPNKTHIYRFEDYNLIEMDGPFKGRLFWNGTQDLQDLSIRINKVKYDDSGVYECHVFRRFEFNLFAPTVLITKDIKLRVKEKASQDTAALYSEITMYVLLVFLTSWLLVEMVYCYRKISRSDEQTQDAAFLGRDPAEGIKRSGGERLEKTD
uniref:Sodium channel regulatory subunit beta-3 n=1 Tax=Takifugu rubripes TaxID=31033 RepID=H2ULE2_TAKRU